MGDAAGLGGPIHRYRATCQWKGDTALGYERYDRAHTVSAPPAPGDLTVSADPAFRGDRELLNPEQLVVLAAASCQLLSFLAIAARARIRVLEYEDQAEAEMPEDDPPVRLTRIFLRPRIVVGPGVSEERVLRFVTMGHEQCFIANSLKTEITIEPKIEVRTTAA